MASELSRRIAELAALAGATGSEPDGTAVAVAAVEIQRLAGETLRGAVAWARESGASWRELSGLLGVPAATLYRQYHADRPSPRPARDPGPSGSARRRVLPPRPADLFTGRDRELADLPALFSRRRLVTLCGPPGVGKTRLALEFCHQQAGARWDRIRWVPLAGGPDGELGPAAEAVAAAGPDGRTLVVLDGCDLVLRRCAQAVARWLDTYPRLTVLVTSREPLRLSGEARVRVPPLPAAPTDRADERLLAAPAVRLFADRAEEAAHDLDLAGQAPLVAAICNAVDGLPLAIELAAQRCATLPLEEIRRELAAGQTAILTGVPHSGLSAPSGLSASIAQSYALLDDAEQRLFRLLSIAPGGADAATAEALAPGLSPLLDGLAHRSMLMTGPATPGWFTMLAPLRAFGRERLDTEGATDATQARLLAHLAERAAGLWARRMRDPGPETWDWAAGEAENLLYAAGVTARTEQPPFPLFAAMSALTRIQRDEFAEADRLLAAVLAIGELSAADEARALVVSAHGLVVRGRHRQARERLTRAHEVASTAGNEDLALRTLSALLCTYSETPAEAALAAERARELVALVRARGDTELLTLTLMRAAWYLMVSGGTAEAAEAVREAVTLGRGRFDADNLATAGTVALRCGDIAAAASYYTAGLPDAGNACTALDHIEGLALVAAERGEYQRALRLIAGAAAIRDQRQLVIGSWSGELLRAAGESARAGLPSAGAAAAAHAGARMTLPQLTEYALHGTAATAEEADRPLNPREYQVASLLAGGHSNKQIAARLSLSVRTVEAHTTKIRRKLGLSSRAQIAHWVATSGGAS